MSKFCKGASILFCGKIWQPLLQTVRYTRRINIKHPRPPHFERALIEALTKPIFAKPIEKYLPSSQTCLKSEEEAIRNYRVDNPYENLLAKDLIQLYNESRLIAICHRNSISAEDKFNMTIRFKRDGMTIVNRGKHLSSLALKGTKFESVLHLCQFHHFVIFCPEPNVSNLLKNIKKTPQIILLAAIIDGYFANVHQVEEYARLKDISHARAQLVSVLNSAAQSIVTGLNQHQTMLVSNLDQYANMKENFNSAQLSEKDSVSTQSNYSTDTPDSSEPLSQ